MVMCILENLIIETNRDVESLVTLSLKHYETVSYECVSMFHPVLLYV